jgi:hypothetical protein
MSGKAVPYTSHESAAPPICHRAESGMARAETAVPGKAFGNEQRIALRPMSLIGSWNATDSSRCTRFT